jgi:hypothetical protein
VILGAGFLGSLTRGLGEGAAEENASMKQQKWWCECDCECESGYVYGGRQRSVVSKQAGKQTSKARESKNNHTSPPANQAFYRQSGNGNTNITVRHACLLTPPRTIGGKYKDRESLEPPKKSLSSGYTNILPPTQRLPSITPPHVSKSPYNKRDPYFDRTLLVSYSLFTGCSFTKIGSFCQVP